MLLKVTINEFVNKKLILISVILGFGLMSAQEDLFNPNPTLDYLNFSGNFSFVQVFDTAGKVLNVTIVNKIADLRNLPKGVYFVKYKSDNGIQMQKILKN